MDTNTDNLDSKNRGDFHLDKYEIPISNCYKLNTNIKLGSGAFSDIYYGNYLKDGTEVAIKLESNKSKHKLLLYECKVYCSLLPAGIYYIINISWNSFYILVWNSISL